MAMETFDHNAEDIDLQLPDIEGAIDLVELMLPTVTPEPTVSHGDDASE